MYGTSKADLGMFSMFGLTGAPTKRRPHKRAIIFWTIFWMTLLLEKLTIKLTLQATCTF